MLRNEVHNEVPFACSPNWSLPSYGHLDFATRQSDDPSAGNEEMPEATEDLVPPVQLHGWRPEA